uniref:Putative oxidoreductase YdgJ n=1 Tax=Arsenophonus endosymbiont of Trialeurodes vaporariorum TaxID=235567 RepID=A0A3B0ML75_9GAMM
MAEQPEVSLIVIPTPNKTHFPLAKQALEAGKHVIVDKPFTLTVQEAVTLNQLAQIKGKLLSIYHNRRWDSGFLTVKSLLEKQILGELKYYESHFDRYRPDVRQRWRESKEAGSGLWYDLAPNMLDQVLQLFGQPKSIFADIAMIRPQAEAVDYFHVYLNYPTLKVVLHATTIAAAESPIYLLHGMEGSYVKYGLDPQEECLKAEQLPTAKDWGKDSHDENVTLSQNGELIVKPLETKPGNYGHYYRAIRQAIINGAPNPVSAEEAILVMKLIEAGIESTKMQHTVDLAL